jgi:hypothetical protein
MLKLLSVAALVAMGSAASVPSVETGAPNITACEVCELVFKELPPLLPKNLTVQQLTADLDKICDVFKNHSNPCKTAIVLVAPQIFKAITGEISPEQACDEIKLCKAGEPAVAAPEKLADQMLRASNVTCELCEKSLEFVAKEIPANFTLQMFTADLKLICADLKNFTKECDLAVPLLAPKIFADITGKVPPAQVCQSIKLCPAALGPMPLAHMQRVIMTGLEQYKKAAAPCPAHEQVCAYAPGKTMCCRQGHFCVPNVGCTCQADDC